MLPHLAELQANFGGEKNAKAFKERRDSQRRGFRDGTSWFVDVVDSNSRLVGTAGFRTIERQDESVTAEFGVIIDSQFHRNGCLKEIFPFIINYAKDSLNVTHFTSLTKPDNKPMRAFLENV